MIQKVIDRFVNPITDDPNLKVENFSGHAARHIWAEFALRRFGGSGVEQHIRRHFRHSYPL